MKAADIPDTHMLSFILDLNRARSKTGGAGWAFTSDLAYNWQEFPRKVVEAKAKQLVKRGLLDGCTCGCRGDFVVTEKGRELLALEFTTDHASDRLGRPRKEDF